MAVNKTINYSLNKPGRGTRDWDVYLNQNTDIIDSELKNLKDKDASQDLRIDNIVANAGNSNTEIVDARLGADGVSRANLGTLVREMHSQLIDSSQQTQTLEHGLSVLNGNVGAPVSIQIEGRTLIPMQNNVLDASKYYVLADKKTRLKWADATTTQGIAKFTGKAERPTLIHVSNFENKVPGSTLENPHKFNHYSQSTLLVPTDSQWVEEDSTGYSRISANDGQVRSETTSINGRQAQQKFSFDIISAIERKLGRIPRSTLADKVAWLKANIANLTCRWYGYGTSPTGNKAYLQRWIPNTDSWFGSASHTSGSVTMISTGTASFGAEHNGTTGNDGWFHVIVYADPSDGTTASTIYTDYVELEIELKPDAVLHSPRVPLYEVTQDSYNNILVTWDENEVMKRYPAVEGVQHVQNPYIVAEGENLLPPFTDPGWTIHANAVVKSPYELELKATANWQATFYTLPCLPNQNYVLTVDHNGYIDVYFYDANNVYISNSKTSTSNTLSFITPSNCTKMTVRLENNTTGTFTFTNPMLTVGNQAKPFVPRNPSYIYWSDVKLGAIGDKKDILFEQDGNYYLRKNVEKDVVLDGSKAWIFWSDQSSYKTVALENAFQNPLTSGNGTSEIVQKFNGNTINFKSLDTDGADSYTFYDAGSGIKRFKLRISDTDSGWGETYTPSANEIKAYFNGWKKSAYFVSDPTTAPTLTATGTTSTLPAGTYYVKYTWVTASGETMASPSASITTTAGQQIDVTLPAFPAGAISANIYISATSGSETKQGSTTTTTYSQTADLVAGSALPSTNTTSNQWVSVVDGSAPTTNTIDYVSANMAPNYTPYKLSYVLATPTTEEVTTEGSITVNGQTQIKVGSGFTYTETDGKRTYSLLTDSQRVANTVNITSATATYANNIRSALDDVAAKVGDIETEVSININAIVDLYARVKALEGGA